MLIEQPGAWVVPAEEPDHHGPMGTNYSTTDGISSERDKQYYEERALAAWR